jgi:hypothetical protein
LRPKRLQARLENVEKRNKIETEKSKVFGKESEATVVEDAVEDDSRAAEGEMADGLQEIRGHLPLDDGILLHAPEIYMFPLRDEEMRSVGGNDLVQKTGHCLDRQPANERNRRLWRGPEVAQEHLDDIKRVHHEDHHH